MTHCRELEDGTELDPERADRYIVDDDQLVITPAAAVTHWRDLQGWPLWRANTHPRHRHLLADRFYQDDAPEPIPADVTTVQAQQQFCHELKADGVVTPRQQPAQTPSQQNRELLP